MKEVICPACGGLIESPDEDGLVALAQEHTLVAHNYDLPREHIIAVMIDI